MDPPGAGNGRRVRLGHDARSLGPLTFRLLGFLVAGVAGHRRVPWRATARPTAEQLALGLAAITLVAFVCLTTMHERYAYPAFVFLLMAATKRALVVAWAAFARGLRAQPGLRGAAARARARTGPAVDAVEVVGALVITGVMLTTVVALLRARRMSAFDDIPTISSWA